MCAIVHEKLTKKKEFDNVFENGRSSYGRFLGIKAIKSDKKINRFGIIVSAKISKKAVDRNRLKRIIRDSVKNIEIKENEYHDIVIVTLPLILEQKTETIKKEIIKNLEKLKIIKK